MQWPPLDYLQTSTGPQITPHQLEQMEIALSKRVGVLTGGPGTGKTFLTSCLIRAIAMFSKNMRFLADNWPFPEIAIAAPTGKAATRCDQMIGNLKTMNVDFALLCEDLDVGINIRTIHSLLGPQRGSYGVDYNEDGWDFVYTNQNQLPHNFYIFDEMSMGDVSITRNLLEAIPNDAHVLFVGDPYQLPSIGHGKVLFDMIAGGIPCGELTEVHRYAGLIGTICQAIKEGRPWKPADCLDLHADYPINWRHVERRSAASTIQVVTQLAKLWKEKGYDFQVICPLGDKAGPLTRKTLNRALQPIMNPGFLDDGQIHIGDRVILRKNSMLKVFSPNPKRNLQETVYVANGDQGVVAQDTGRDGMSVHLDRGGWVLLTKEYRKKYLELAYAITCHLSQGSEWERTIVVADNSPGAEMVCGPAWWRTAGSRSKCTVTVGCLDTIYRHCRKPWATERTTLLAEKIGQCLHDENQRREQERLDREFNQIGA